MTPEAHLQSYLKKAGIEPAATKVYLELNKDGPSSALQLAKGTGMSRTQVYRYLDALQLSGLVSAEQLSYGTLFRALPLENLEGLIIDRETQATELRTRLSDMATLLQHLAGSKGLRSYDLTNAEQVKAAELEPFNPRQAEIRHIDPEILRINFEVYIYNQVVALLDYSAENTMAIEIHHPSLHAMMRQLFDAMWNLGTPLVIE
jgi:Fe2+ or Zn2+ uptake regulation protein